MTLKGTDTDQQREAFRQHLNEASEVVASWEPWERAILGTKQNGTSGAAGAATTTTNTTTHVALECNNNRNGSAAADNQEQFQSNNTEK